MRKSASNRFLPRGDIYCLLSFITRKIRKRCSKEDIIPTTERNLYAIYQSDSHNHFSDCYVVTTV